MTDSRQPAATHVPDPDSEAVKPQSALRTALAGLIGNVLEWFDFAVYGYFATDIGHQFFPQNSAAAQQLLTFGAFALGFFARPFGSLVLGSVGDRIGRRALLTLSIALMGGATLILGLLPTYEQIGVAAPLLLMLMRIVQGFSLGGEFTGSMVYTTEKSSPLMRGLVSSSTAAGHDDRLHPRVGRRVAGERLAAGRPGRRRGAGASRSSGACCSSSSATCCAAASARPPKG